MTEQEKQKKTDELIELLKELERQEEDAKKNIAALVAIIKSATEGRKNVYLQAKDLGIIHPELCQHWMVEFKNGKTYCCNCGTPTSVLDPVKT